jgi:hypothetical protein
LLLAAGRRGRTPKYTVAILMAVLSTLPPVACCRRRALQRRDLCALMAAWLVVAAHLAAAPEPATPPAAAQGGGAAPAPLEAMLRGDATADFGDAGPVAVKLPQRAARTGDVWCGDVWCAVLLPEHFHAGNQVSPSGNGARPSPYGGKLAPIAVPAKKNTGGTLPAFGVLRGARGFASTLVEPQSGDAWRRYVAGLNLDGLQSPVRSVGRIEPNAADDNQATRRALQRAAETGKVALAANATQDSTDATIARTALMLYLPIYANAEDGA